MDDSPRSRSDKAQAPLGTYLHDIRRTPLLTTEEEKELARRFRTGDAAARHHLIQANLRLVVSIARRYVGRGLLLEDLISEGNLGLLRAVESYNPDRNTRFSTYARYWVKRSIHQALIRMARTVRIPAYAAQLLSKWHRAASELRKDLHRPPTDEEVAERLGLKRKSECIEKALRSRHTGTPISEEGSRTTLPDLLPDGRVKSPDVMLAKAEEIGKLLRLLDRLPQRAALVLRLHFGLGGEEPVTLEKIGGHLGLTRERVHQIEKSALADLAVSLQHV